MRETRRKKRDFQAFANFMKHGDTSGFFFFNSLFKKKKSEVSVYLQKHTEMRRFLTSCSRVCFTRVPQIASPLASKGIACLQTLPTTGTMAAQVYFEAIHFNSILIFNY